MTTFNKINTQFQLKYNAQALFAPYLAKSKKTNSAYTEQLNNIRIKPLNLRKNGIISNILLKTSKYNTVTKPNNILFNNFVLYFLIKNMSKSLSLTQFLTNYFYFSKETLNNVWSFYITNEYKIYTKLNTDCLNNYLFSKIGELAFYYNNLTLLNNKQIINNYNLFLNLNNFWLVNSFPNNINEKGSSISFIYSIVQNKNHVVNYNTHILLKEFNQINLANTNSVLIKKEITNQYLYAPFQNYLEIPTNYLYILLRIEEKIHSLKALQKSEASLKKLTVFYNFLLEILTKNTNKSLTTDFILGNLNTLNKVKNINFGVFINKTIKKIKNEKKALDFFNKVKNRFFIKHKAINFSSKESFKKYEQTGRLNAVKEFTNKKLELTQQYTKTIYNKNILTTVLKKNTKIFYVNALALTKFGFLLEKKSASNQNFNVNPNKFLANLDREMISKYKYIGVYIKDLIRVAFIALFLKKPAFLAKFIAFQLNVLPKNRKETSFIRFIIKLVKTFAAEREEILGLRIKFKGRVNRWRRTKVILGQRGILPLHTIQNRIEYGSAQGINRKGAVGVHIWIWYNPIFKTLLKNTYQKYFSYSKYLNYKKKSND